MEWLELLLILLIDGIDLIAWIESRSNRRNRREAKKTHDAVPARSRWNWLFWCFLPIAAILTLSLIWRWLR